MWITSNVHAQNNIWFSCIIKMTGYKQQIFLRVMLANLVDISHTQIKVNLQFIAFFNIHDFPLYGIT